MFGLSFGELVIIAVLALVLLGPDRLPDAMKTVGKGLREFKKATDDLKDQIESEIYDDRKARPSLVPPVPAAQVPGPAGPPPPATVENVPGLEAALVDSGEAPPPAAAAAAAEPPANPEPPPAATPRAS